MRLGCVLFILATGRAPFSGEGPGDIIAQHIFQPPPASRTLAPTVSTQLEALVARAAKDPARDSNRWRSSRPELARIADLAPVRGPSSRGERAASRPETTLESARRERGRGRRWVWFGGGLAAVAVTTALVIRGGGDGIDGEHGRRDAGAASQPVVNARRHRPSLRPSHRGPTSKPAVAAPSPEPVAAAQPPLR